MPPVKVAHVNIQMREAEFLFAINQLIVWRYKFVFHKQAYAMRTALSVTVSLKETTGLYHFYWIPAGVLDLVHL